MTEPLTIGIDARAAEEVGGGRGRVVRELLRALAARAEPHRYLLFARRRWQEPLDERFEWRLIAARDPLWHLRAARAANRSCDVFLSTNSYLTVWALRRPSVAIVYDMVAFDPALRPRWRSSAIERATLPLAVRRATELIAISRATADALAARLPRAAAKSNVVALAVSPQLLGPAGENEETERAGVLAVGTLEPRKNLPRLVAAYSALPRELQDAHPLLVSGEVGWDTGETMRALRSLGDRCRLLGYVPDAELAALYQRCAVFCYPSLGEGFGLPVLEAMHAGAAVLTSDRSGLPEVGGDAAVYTDPTDAGAIGAALAALLRDPERRRDLGARARARAAEFSWDRTAGQTLAVLERAARRSLSPRPGDAAAGHVT